MSILDILLIVVVVLVVRAGNIRESVFSSSHLITSKIEGGFDFDSTATLKGAAMLGIILHHIHKDLGHSSPLLLRVGYLATAFFFFVSGYGNAISINKQIKITISWLTNKYKKIFFPYIVAYIVVFIGMKHIYHLEPYGFKDIIEDVFTISLINQAAWFPRIILLCFTIHWIAKRITKNIFIQNVCITGCILIYILMMYINKEASYWYNSVLCYAVGCFMVSVRTDVSNKLFAFLEKKAAYLCLLLLVAFFVVMSFGEETKWYLQIICAVFFSLICYYITFIFRFNSDFLRNIGNNSFEYYLFHGVVRKLCAELIGLSACLYVFAVLLFSIVIVNIYNKGKNSFFTLFNKQNEFKLR